MAYLSQAKFAAGSCEAEDQLEDRLRSNPLYEYAAKNWGRHIGNTRLPPPPEVVSFLTSRPKVEATCQVAMTVRRYEATPLDCKGFAKNMSGMHVGAYVGARNIVEESLESRAAADVLNLRDSQGQTPLSWAAQGGHAAIVEPLLAEPRTDVNVRNSQGRTPPSLAAEHGHLQVARTLLDRGAKANLKDAYGMVPPWHAAKADYAGLVRLLLGLTETEYLNLMPPQSMRGSRDRTTAFSTAVKNGHTEVVKILLDQDIVDFRFWDFEESMSIRDFLSEFVVENGYEEMATHILDKYELSFWDGFAFSSEEKLLHWAVENGCVKMARRLLSHHAVDPNSDRGESRWHPKMTTLMLACNSRRSGECVVRMLLETKGIQPELRREDGQTVLSIAAAQGNGGIV